MSRGMGGVRRKRARGFAEVLDLDFLELDDFTAGELANLQRKDPPRRESDKPGGHADGN